MDVWVYFEGHKSLRPGLSTLLTQAVGDYATASVRIRPVAGGGKPVKYFVNALRTKRDDLNLLLVDCEGPADSCSMESLRQRADWTPPSGAQVDESQVFWMVEIMESWFIADKEALKAYYGNKFEEGKLPANPRVEQVPKSDVLSGLKAASTRTQKGRYHKTKHALHLLARVDPAKIRRAAPAAKRLFDYLRAAAAG